MKNFLKILILLLVFVGTVHAQSSIITCSGNDCYVVNDNDGKLIIGTAEDNDIELITNQSSSDPEGIALDDSAAALIPLADDNISLGTASLEFKDAFFDGTVTLDALSMPLSVVAGANTACSTTCTGLCMFGVNTAATEADIVDCADATADECLCVE